jgi:diguanylate cyclase (GGDEF)-like protein
MHSLRLHALRCLPALLVAARRPAPARASQRLTEPAATTRPDLVVEATLRLLPASPLVFLAVSAMAGVTALGLTTRNTLLLQASARQHERDLEVLQARERRLRRSVHDSEDGLAHLEPVRNARGEVVDFIVTDANARTAALFRRPPAAIPGMRTSSLASLANDTTLFRALVDALATGTTYRDEVRAHPRHVATSWLRVRAVPVDGGLALTLTDIRDRKRETLRLRRASHADPLTGLLNRRGFVECATPLLVSARQHGHDAHLFYLDCDAFKDINDTHGHAVGDRALLEIARALRVCMRESDVIARLGGDEFAVLAQDTVGDCADRIRARIDARIDALNRAGLLPMPVGVTIGHVNVPAATTASLAELLDAADRDLMHRKAARRVVRRSMDAIAHASRPPRARAEARSQTRTHATAQTMTQPPATGSAAKVIGLAAMGSELTAVPSVA